jgi:hypothetical protein
MTIGEKSNLFVVQQIYIVIYYERPTDTLPLNQTIAVHDVHRFNHTFFIEFYETLRPNICYWITDSL